MRCAHAVALLLTGSTAVLSFTIPKSLHRVPILAQIGELTTRCPQPILDLLPNIIKQIETTVKAGNDTTPLLVEVTQVLDACEALGPVLKGDLTPRQNGPSNSSAIPAGRHHHKSLLAHVNHIATKCPRPVLKLVPDIIDNFKKAHKAGTHPAPLWIVLARISAACDAFGPILKRDLTPHQNGSSNSSAIPAGRHHKSLLAHANDIATKCPRPVLKLVPDIIDNFENAHKVGTHRAPLWIVLARISAACDAFGPILKRDITPYHEDPSHFPAILPGLKHKPFYSQIVEIATKCPQPVLEKLPLFFKTLGQAHEAKIDPAPFWLEVALLVHTCELLFKPNLIAPQSGPSNSSAHVPHLSARQSPDLDLGKQYSPTDPDFLAALAKALFEKRWAFYFKDQGFWTAHVTKAITHHKYDQIFSMDQERKIEAQMNAEKAAVLEAKIEKKTRVKAAKKAKKEAEKEKLKQMTPEERKQYKAETKAVKKAEKEDRKRAKQEYKAYKAGIKETLAKGAKERNKYDKQRAWEAKVGVAEEKRKFFANGRGPAIGEDNLEWTQ